jgi:hypothetical protein
MGFIKNLFFPKVKKSDYTPGPMTKLQAQLAQAEYGELSRFEPIRKSEKMRSREDIESLYMALSSADVAQAKKGDFNYAFQERAIAPTEEISDQAIAGTQAMFEGRKQGLGLQANVLSGARGGQRVAMDVGSQFARAETAGTLGTAASKYKARQQVGQAAMGAISSTAGAIRKRLDTPVFDESLTITAADGTQKTTGGFRPRTIRDIFRRDDPIPAEYQPTGRDRVALRRV